MVIELKRIPKFVDVLPYKDIINTLMWDLRAINPFERSWVVCALNNLRKLPSVADK